MPTDAELARQERRDHEPASVLLERIRAVRAADVICTSNQPPDEARGLMDELEIANDYCAAIAEDLTDEQAEAKMAELRALCVALVGQ